jgi:superfamily II DNA/RNA helicase
MRSLCGVFCCAQVIVGTHGRLKNWVAKRQLDVDRICILVFDEADEMLKADAFADDSGERHRLLATTALAAASRAVAWRKG